MTTRSRSGQAFTAVTQVPALAAALHSGLGLHHHNILLILRDDGVVFVYVSKKQLFHSHFSDEYQGCLPLICVVLSGYQKEHIFSHAQSTCACMLLKVGLLGLCYRSV